MMMCAIDLVDASLETIAGNLDRANISATRCFETSALNGFGMLRAGSATNLGFLALSRTDIRRAHEFLEQGVALTNELSFVRLAVLDNHAQLAIYEEDLDRCDRYLKECEKVIASQEVPSRSWYDLAHQVTRCTALAQFDDWEGIVEIARACEGELERRQFRSLRTAMLCAAARAYARLGDHAKAESRLGAAVRACPRGAVDPQIVLEAATAACLTLRGERTRGAAHFDRALSAARAIGNRLHEWHIQRDRAACTITRVTPSPLDAAPPSLVSERATVLSDAATILGAGSSIDLIAHRALSLLNGTPMESRLHVRSTSGEEFRPEPSLQSQVAADGTFHIDLRGSDRRVQLTVRQVESLDDVTMLKSLLDLLQAAVHRTADAESSADDQNLWPTTLLPGDDDVVFRSPRMTEVLRVAMRLADTDLPILITGETGTGKDVIARLIHGHSRQKRGPFVPFNCSAIPKDLIESQLFGHRRGAFTGAVEASPGVIRAAEGGTLFLDEIGDLEPALQPKLLRFLESGEVHTVGDARPARTHVRVLAATNIDLDERSQSGTFRRDLFFRLGTAHINLPPLRERKDEIPALSAYFVNRFSRECDRPGLRVSDDLIAALLLHDWPGNIRQLGNELRRIVAMAEPGQTLSSEDLSDQVTQGWRRAHGLLREKSDGPSITVDFDQPLPDAVEAVERAFIDRAMLAAGGRVAEAAQLLGISRKGLFLKRRRWVAGDDSELPAE
jgi:DNA-binding NtrC family response regulator